MAKISIERSASVYVSALTLSLTPATLAYGLQAVDAPAEPAAPEATAAGAAVEAAGTTQAAGAVDASASEAEQAARAVVVSVVGSVQVRPGAEASWQIAQAGMVLSSGTEIRTGMRSVVVIRHGGQQLTFDRTGRYTLDQVSRRTAADGSPVDVTRVNIQTGIMRFEVDEVDAKNDLQVSTPDVTLAVTGTIGGVGVDASGTNTFGEEGTFVVTPIGSTQSQTVGAGDQTNVDADGDVESTTDTASDSSTADTNPPGSNATEDEQDAGSRGPGGGDPGTSSITGDGDRQTTQGQIFGTDGRATTSELSELGISGEIISNLFPEDDDDDDAMRPGFGMSPGDEGMSPGDGMTPGNGTPSFPTLDENVATFLSLFGSSSLQAFLDLAETDEASFTSALRSFLSTFDAASQEAEAISLAGSDVNTVLGVLDPDSSRFGITVGEAVSLFRSSIGPSIETAIFDEFDTDSATLQALLEMFFGSVARGEREDAANALAVLAVEEIGPELGLLPGGSGGAFDPIAPRPVDDDSFVALTLVADDDESGGSGGAFIPVFDFSNLQSDLETSGTSDPPRIPFDDEDGSDDDLREDNLFLEEDPGYGARQLENGDVEVIAVVGFDNFDNTYANSIFRAIGRVLEDVEGNKLIGDVGDDSGGEFIAEEDGFQFIGQVITEGAPLTGIDFANDPDGSGPRIGLYGVQPANFFVDDDYSDYGDYYGEGYEGDKGESLGPAYNGETFLEITSSKLIELYAIEPFDGIGEPMIVKNDVIDFGFGGPSFRAVAGDASNDAVLLVSTFSESPVDRFFNDTSVQQPYGVSVVQYRQDVNALTYAWDDIVQVANESNTFVSGAGLYGDLLVVSLLRNPEEPVNGEQRVFDLSQPNGSEDIFLGGFELGSSGSPEFSESDIVAGLASSNSIDREVSAAPEIGGLDELTNRIASSSIPNIETRAMFQGFGDLAYTSELLNESDFLETWLVERHLNTSSFIAGDVPFDIDQCRVALLSSPQVQGELANFADVVQGVNFAAAAVEATAGDLMVCSVTGEMLVPPPQEDN